MSPALVAMSSLRWLRERDEAGDQVEEERHSRDRTDAGDEVFEAAGL